MRMFEAMLHGAAIAFLLGIVYNAFEHFGEGCDPHQLGMWEGVVVTLLMTNLMSLSKRVLNRKRGEDDRA